MAIIDSFDSSSQAVISPEQMVTPIDGFPDTMVVTFQARTFAVLMDLHETTALAEVHLEESIES
ncbi:MAG: hypothetical protein FWD55_04145, partial [Propionibacteriaceae bacterium]|nr:hypothetical protein [Propionibacteriaceae bacterium]